MYLIDGNNVIGGRVGWHRDKDGSRRQLLRDLSRLARVRKLRLTVVFDGAPDNAFPDGSVHRGVKVFYARRGSDADTRIVEMAEAERNKKNLVVVTSDGKLTARVRVCGVRVMRAGEFRQMLDEASEERGQQEGNVKGSGEPTVREDEMSQWMRYFGASPEDDEDDEEEGAVD